MDEGGGNAGLAARLFANFASQRLVAPFNENSADSPTEKFGANAVATLKAARAISRKPGSQADMFRRHILGAGAQGPLSPEPVISY